MSVRRYSTSIIKKKDCHSGKFQLRRMNFINDSFFIQITLFSNILNCNLLQLYCHPCQWLTVFPEYKFRLGHMIAKKIVRLRVMKFQSRKGFISRLNPWTVRRAMITDRHQSIDINFNSVYWSIISKKKIYLLYNFQ